MRVFPHLLLWSVGLASAQTQTTGRERECLARYAHGKRRLVEIGVWHGVTTRVLRNAMAANGELFAVDPFPVGRLGFSAQRIIAHSEVNRVPKGTVSWIRTTGIDAARQWKANALEPTDFVFVDGDHSYDGIRGDWMSWSGLIAIGGFVALHDSQHNGARENELAGSVRFTRDVVMCDQRFEIAEIVDTLTVLRRVGTVTS